ncbi:MAG: DUF1572 family protein [Caldilineaceae bacterium]
MTNHFIQAFKTNIIAQYQEQKKWADDALARCDDRTFFATLGDHNDDHTNSIAILVKHIAGNFRSRWTDFLTTDGEKPDRNRPSEFVDEGNERVVLMRRWDEAWAIAFGALQALEEEDFEKTIMIRGESLRVIQAIHRNLIHAAHHIGQIDLLATALK